jgi:hypothetical protein
VLTDIFSASIFVYFDKTTRTVVSSPLWPDYFALEGFVTHLIWPMSYPILAAMPLAVAMPVQLIVGSIYISNNSNMCRNALKMYPRTEQLCTRLHTVLGRVATSLPFSSNNKTVLGKPVVFLENNDINKNEAMCSNILVCLEVTMVIVVCLYLLFISEISDRQVYCADTGKRALQGELKRRRPYAWQLLGETAVAWILLWNAVTLLSDYWKFRM